MQPTASEGVTYLSGETFAANQCNLTSSCNGQPACNRQRCGGHCRRALDNWHAYFQYEPQLSCPGDYIYQNINAQIANGRTAQMVFYGFHFQFNPQTGTWQLTRSGRDNVYRLARILPVTPGSIVIPSSGDSAADNSKLQLVSDALSRYGLHQTPIVIGHVNTSLHGLPGVEAGDIFQRRLLGSPYANRSNDNLTLSRGAGSRVRPGPGAN